MEIGKTHKIDEFRHKGYDIEIHEVEVGATHCFMEHPVTEKACYRCGAKIAAGHAFIGTVNGAVILTFFDDPDKAAQNTRDIVDGLADAPVTVSQDDRAPDRRVTPLLPPRPDAALVPTKITKEQLDDMLGLHPAMFENPPLHPVRTDDLPWNKRMARQMGWAQKIGAMFDKRDKARKT